MTSRIGCGSRLILKDFSSRSSQFQHVVGTADYTPLRGDLGQAPQQERSEAPRLFDLAKHGGRPPAFGADSDSATRLVSGGASARGLVASGPSGARRGAIAATAAAICQGSPKFPQLWSSKIPHPG